MKRSEIQNRERERARGERDRGMNRDRGERKKERERDECLDELSLASSSEVQDPMRKPENFFSGRSFFLERSSAARRAV